MKRLLLAATAAALSLPAVVQAEVAQRTDTGFRVLQSADVAAPPAKVYAALTRIGAWWDPAHTYSGRAENMTLTAEPGGCFCERLDGGGGVRHGTVVLAMPGALLRLDAPLGPLQGEGVSTALTFELKPQGAGTRLVADYRVGGFTPEGVKQWSDAVDQVLGVQVTRLARYAETTKP